MSDFIKVDCPKCKAKNSIEIKIESIDHKGNPNGTFSECIKCKYVAFNEMEKIFKNYKRNK